MIKKMQSDFLFAQPSFMSGVARVMDLWGSFDAYNTSETSEEADAIAIASDWAVIGQDVQTAIDQFKSEEALV